MSRADSPRWTRAKAAGDETEALVVRWLQGRGADVLRFQGRAAADLEARWRFECKRDLLAPTTGKVAVEVSYRGKPSGIMATDAAHWFIHVGDELYMVDAARLRALVTSRPYDERDAGDGKNARVKLVPLGDLASIARTVADVGRTP